MYQAQDLRLRGGQRLLLFDGIHGEGLSDGKPGVCVRVRPWAEEVQDGVGVVREDHIALCVSMCVQRFASCK